VVAAVRELERCEVFNAGRGAVLDRDGHVALDAAVMEGGARRAGGVVGVSRILHPIEAALAVLKDGRHVLYAGEGAERFARAAGVTMVDAGFHVTDERRAQLARALADRRACGRYGRRGGARRARPSRRGDLDGRHGGARSGPDRRQRAAGQRHLGRGRHLRGLRDRSRRVLHPRGIRARHRRAHALCGPRPRTACAGALAEVAALGGHGGCIAVGAHGAPALHFDTPDMPRGLRMGTEHPQIALRGREPLARY
jgi:beta-aspartyl-peptidase (threonine type)